MCKVRGLGSKVGDLLRTLRPAIENQLIPVTTALNRPSAAKEIEFKLPPQKSLFDLLCSLDLTRDPQPESRDLRPPVAATRFNMI